MGCSCFDSDACCRREGAQRMISLPELLKLLLCTVLLAGGCSRSNEKNPELARARAELTVARGELAQARAELEAARTGALKTRADAEAATAFATSSDADVSDGDCPKCLDRGGCPYCLGGDTDCQKCLGRNIC